MGTHPRVCRLQAVGFCLCCSCLSCCWHIPILMFKLFYAWGTVSCSMGFCILTTTCSKPSKHTMHQKLHAQQALAAPHTRCSAVVCVLQADKRCTSVPAWNICSHSTWGCESEQWPMSAAVCRLAQCGCLLLWLQQLALHPPCQDPPTLHTGNTMLLGVCTTGMHC